MAHSSERTQMSLLSSECHGSCIPGLTIDGTGTLCRFVDAEAVEEVLEEMGRLMPNQDPKMVLLRDPSWLLRVERGTKRLGPHPDDICMPPASPIPLLSLQALGTGLPPYAPWF